MNRAVSLLSRTGWQVRSEVCAANSRRAFCGLLMLLVVTSCGGGGGGATAPPPPPLTATAQTLYTFGSNSPDAMGPSGVLFKGSDGNFFGTTPTGGVIYPTCYGSAATNDPFYIGCGTVFKMTPAGEETVLHLFAGVPDGSSPVVLIQGSDGNFYGTTQFGGPDNLGTVFKLTPEGVETILYSFTGGADGYCPAGGLIQASDGNFYGTTGCEVGSTTRGGTNGTVFKLTPQGVLTTLYSFAGTSYGGPDGAVPTGQLVQGSDGNFYGVTLLGGLTSPVVNNTTTCGTVFKVTPGGVETILHRFSGPDGQNPNGLIQGSDGNFYGTTQGANTSFGTIFRVTPEGELTILHSLGPPDIGAFPKTNLVQGSDGNFYGTTSDAGDTAAGTAFRVTPDGVFTEFYSFPFFPNELILGGGTNLVQGSDGALYGGTYYGGTNDDGYFFKLVLSSP